MIATKEMHAGQKAVGNPGQDESGAGEQSQPMFINACLDARKSIHAFRHPEKELQEQKQRIMPTDIKATANNLSEKEMVISKERIYSRNASIRGNGHMKGNGEQTIRTIIGNA